ncbi:MAG: exodeoxyribonuclease V subunit gamma [Acinetobacter sp.]
MGIHVCQSQRLDILAQVLMVQQQAQGQASPLQALQPQHFIVPNLAIEQWLKQYISQYQGISANQVFHQRIQTFQWYAYQQVLIHQQERVRQANIPRIIMKWQIYDVLQPYIQPTQLDMDQHHPLYAILQRIYDSASQLPTHEQRKKKQSMLYWVSEQVSRLFSHYMTYRGQCMHADHEPCQCRSNWLKQWGNHQAIDIEQALNSYETSITAEYLQQIQQLEAWQRWLWQHVFHQDFQEMRQIDHDFWHILDDPYKRDEALQQLPAQVTIFTLLELAPSQLHFLRRLGQYLDVYIFHYNPSQEYWADSVDPNWKKQYDVKVKERFIEKNRQYGKAVSDEDIAKFFNEFTLNFNAEARESRHPLLTRFGKQARDHFSLLASLSAGEEGEWHDVFDENYPDTLLGKVQSDILYLMEPEQHQFALQDHDHSIQIHVCHSALRQLEVLKEQLLHWLAQSTPEQPRRLDDILVLCPNLKTLEPHIRSVFAPIWTSSRTQHQGTEMPYLAIKIGGVVQFDVLQAWQALVERIRLPQRRFQFAEFADWLSLLATQQHYGLDVAAIERILALLAQAGFKRGLDATHLAQELNPQDHDYRFSFKFALDRLVMGYAVPAHVIVGETLSDANVNTEDFSLIATLIQIYQDLQHRRFWLDELDQQSNRDTLQHNQNIEYWIDVLIDEVATFSQKAPHLARPNNARVALLSSNTAFQKISEILIKFKRMLSLSFQNEQNNVDAHTHLQQLSLPLSYLLEEIEQQLQSNLEQAQPSGEITFSQIGQIRPIPYKLMVLLNLDSGVFPNRQQKIPFDLMSVLKPQLGDRSRIEDDQGAFLDALLLAKEQFWMFYNGFDVNDGEIRQPASVVQELVDHLAFIVQPAVQDSAACGEITETINIHGIDIAKHLQSLFYVHPLQPFDPAGFHDAHIKRFQDSWFYVAHNIANATGQRQAWSQTPLKPWTHPSHGQSGAMLAQDVVTLNSHQWLNDVTFPAQLYLRTLGVENLHANDDEIDMEPLLLDGLGRYAVRDFLQQHDSHYPIAQHSTDHQFQLDPKLLADRLPVGKVQQATWQISITEYQLLLDKLHQYAPEPTITTQHLLQLSQDLHLRIDVPEQQDKLWVSLNPSSSRAERRAKTWLEYLLWLAYLDTAAHDLQRIVVFSDYTVICSGINSQQARHYLQDWHAAWIAGQQAPLVLPAALLLKPMEKQKQIEWIEDDRGQMVIEDISVLLKQWQGEQNFNTQFSVKEDRSTKQHQDWQFILQEQDATALLINACQRYAYQLYAPIYQHMQCEGNV